MILYNLYLNLGARYIIAHFFMSVLGYRRIEAQIVATISNMQFISQGRTYSL